MEMCSIGSPLMMVVSLALAIFLAFSSSVVQSQSTAGQPPLPPTKFHPSPPPPPLKQGNGHHQVLPPEQAKKGNGHHQVPPPEQAKKGSGHHQAPPPDEKGAKSTTAKSKGLNAGKIVGMVFSGIVMILQIGVVGYLTYKRNQLYNAPD